MILFAAFYRSLVARHALQFRNINPIQNHRQLTGAQFHRSRALLHSRYFENPDLQALIPKYEAVPVPHQNFQTISTTRTEHKQMAALRVLSNDRSHTFRQAIESAAHVRYFAGHPDPRSLRTIHRLQACQPDHSAASTTTNNAHTCSASNPGLTIRLRPFLSRISTLESPGVLGPCPATCTSRNFFDVSSSSRFFHTKKYGRLKPCSRQNAFTLSPLPDCSETSLRHFIQALFERLVMSQHCIAT